MNSVHSNRLQEKKVHNLSLAFVANPEPNVESQASNSFWTLGKKALDAARQLTMSKSEPAFRRNIDRLFQAMKYRHNRLYQAFRKEREMRRALEKRGEFLEALLSAKAVASGRMIETSLRSEKLSPIAAENKALKDMLKEAELELIRYKSLYRDAAFKSTE